MTDDGHCDHCQVGCQGQDGRTHLGTESRDFIMMWSAGHCPACAERARIAAAIEADRSRYRSEFPRWFESDYNSGMLRAIHVVRGEPWVS